MIREKINEPILGYRTRGHGFAQGRRTTIKAIIDARTAGRWTPDEHDNWIRAAQSRLESLRGKPEYRRNQCFVAGRMAVLRSSWARDYSTEEVLPEIHFGPWSVGTVLNLLGSMLVALLHPFFHPEWLSIAGSLLVIAMLFCAVMAALDEQRKKSSLDNKNIVNYANPVGEPLQCRKS